MKIYNDEKGEMCLSEVYNGIKLVTNAGETIGICMRDSGFEFVYEGNLYRAQEGVISQVNSIPVPVEEEQIDPPPTSFELKSSPIQEITQNTEEKKVEAPEIPVIPQLTRDEVTPDQKTRGFLRPIRNIIVHKCGARSILSDALAEVIARDPKHATDALCSACGKFLPIVEFNWEGIDEKLGS